MTSYGTVQITIWRDEVEIPVYVEIIRYYKGIEAADDPSECETDIYGFDDSGKSYLLSLKELEDAESAFFNQ